jgi:uncharacterized protein YceH (UPF0502 family)
MKVWVDESTGYLMMDDIADGVDIIKTSVYLQEQQHTAELEQRVVELEQQIVELEQQLTTEN